jgi:ATP-binding cassette, subfamily B, bacterial
MQLAILRLFWQNAWHFKRYILGILLLLPVVVLMHQFLPPLVLSGILNHLASGNYTQGDLWGSFGGALVLFIGLRFISATIVWRIVIVWLYKLEGHVVAKFNKQIFAHLLSQSARFHSDHLGGSLVAATTRFTNAYGRLAESIAFQFIPMLFSFLFTAIILLPRAPLYVVCLIGLSMTYVLVTILGTRKVREKSIDEAKAQGAQTGALTDSLTNIMAIKGFGADKFESNRFNDITHQAKTAFFDMVRTTHSRELFFSTITATITCISIVLAIAGVVLFNADIATTFLIIEYTGLLTARLWEFTISTLRTYNRAIGDASDMTKILATPPDVQDPARPKKPRINRGKIVFSNVTFSHADANDTIFSDLSVTIRPGERVGLVGHSGAGKTTFIKLLMRLADIDSGSISVDNQNIAHITQASLRSHISYVPQEPLLFHRTIKENIAYGDPAANDQAIYTAAKQAHAADFIEQLPRGYDTVVGERGVKLSGGQRQRIAIARAILKKAPILILDEATSALDSESEREIQRSMETLMKRRTTIAIAHRLSTIAKLDRIIVLDDGRIIEDGTHDELLKKSGAYARLWAHQSGGFIEE